MGNESEILEPDLGFILETTSPEEVIESLGIIGYSMEQCFDLLKTGANAALKTFQNYDPKDLKAYHSIGRKYAPIAFFIYSYFFDKKQEPRLPAWMICNRFEACQCFPNTIIFWSDPDVICGLYESLTKEGHYAGS